MKKIAIVVGTRPELIKVGCLVRELEKRGYREKCILVNTAQHKELLEPYWKLFELQPDITLDVMRHGQSLSQLTSRVLTQFQHTVDQAEGQLAGILAQGDTTTVLGTAMVAFYNQIPFYHLEAGLRSFNLQNPYPEEFNRKATSLVTSFHFCPTDAAKTNLLEEGVREEKISVVGNTVIDALQYIKQKIHEHPHFENKALQSRIEQHSEIVLITCHRRENQGNNLIRIMDAIGELAVENPHTAFVWTLHPSPNVSAVVLKSKLKSQANIILIEPLSYYDLIKTLSRSTLAISDSGGIQEEAPSFNVPVLVLREYTERPEGLAVGAAVLVGADKAAIKTQFYHFRKHGIDLDHNPYGDGKSAARVAEKLIEFL